MTTLRLRIRDLREALGLSQQALSDRAGLTQATVSNLETGRATRVDLKTLERLAKALGVAPGELFAPPAKKRR